MSRVTSASMGCFFFLASALVGCQARYDHTDITGVGTSELSQSISDSRASLKVGDILTATVTPYNTDGNPMIESVTSDDTGIVQVLPTETASQFALLGVAAGNTTLRLHADGELESLLTVTVAPQ